jgi:hypothetical protein
MTNNNGTDPTQSANHYYFVFFLRFCCRYDGNMMMAEEAVGESVDSLQPTKCLNATAPISNTSLADVKRHRRLRIFNLLYLLH